MKVNCSSSRCRRGAVLAVAMILGACADPSAPPRTLADASLPGADAAVERTRDRGAQLFYTAYLAELLRGDTAAARAGYQQVVGDSSAEAHVIARASLRLAALESSLGHRDRANDLIARALTVAGDDSELLVRADRMRARTAASGASVPGRGPAPGTEVEGANARAAELFGRAEVQMQAYYQRPLAPRIEGLSGVLRGNKAALENVARIYREAGTADPLVSVASRFRIGALYHNSALAMFSVPPELEPAAAARLRRTLRRRALTYLGRAQASYRAALEAADGLPAEQVVRARRWRIAAESGLAAVDELLQGRN